MLRRSTTLLASQANKASIAMASSPSTSLKVLMLHGYTQSGSLFHAKTRALEKQLNKAFPAPAYNLQLVYPTGPIHIKPADFPGSAAAEDEEDSETYGWWRRKDEGGTFYYRGIEDGLARVAETIRSDGPFDGVMGFSQGGALAGMVASLLQPGRVDAFRKGEANGGMPYPQSFLRDAASEQSIQPPLKFAVSYSGFGPTQNDLYHAFYNPPIATPMLHFLGSVDTVVEESRSLRLVDACVDGRGKDGNRLVYHPGSHFLPCATPYVAPLIAFIHEALGLEIGAAKAQEDGRAEDMDVPF